MPPAATWVDLEIIILTRSKTESRFLMMSLTHEI